MEKNYTIKDIARLTNLSRGTIDKVLHNRGGVSEETVEKVQAVIKQVGYTPNILAKSLKQHKRYVIAVLLPHYRKGGYWHSCYLGAKRASEEVVSFSGEVRYFFYERSIEDFRKQFSLLLEAHPDALLVAPLDYVEIREVYQKLHEVSIPFVFINSAVAQTGYDGFIGQDYYTSGRVAAQMMDFLTPKRGPLLVLHKIEALEYSGHLAEKEKGFISYFKAHQPNRTIQVLTLYDQQIIQPLAVNVQAFEGVFLTTSNAFECIEEFADGKLKVVSYDLIPENAERLRRGNIQVLLNQNPGMQGFLGLSALMEYLLFKIEIQKEKYLPIEIITSENLQSYLSAATGGSSV
jgi:LacI family transcriptional regulator